MQIAGRHFLLSLLMGWSLPLWAVPITDTVTVNGTTWAQVDLFAGLSWNNIEAICPAGACETGSLNGFDMTGWQWASTSDLATAFNPFLEDSGFGGDDLLSAGPDRFFWGFSNPQADFGRHFINEGFRPTYQQFGDRVLTGWISNPVPGDANLAYQGVVGDYPGQTQAALFGTDYTQRRNRGGLFSPGAWFFRADNNEVPVPATLPLFVIGILAIAFSRLKRHFGFAGVAVGVD